MYSVSVKLYSMGTIKKWKFQNPKISINAFYLYMSFCSLFNHRQIFSFCCHKCNILFLNVQKQERVKGY